MDIIKVNNVTKRFIGHTALDNVSLTIPQGCVYGLLGPNGAGKTTLIRIINHITAPDSGRVEFDGHQLVESDVRHIGYLPEERGLYKKMKVGEQALFFARLKGLSKSDATARLKEWFEKFGITDWWDKKVEELSKGMAQKIQFIITVLHQPKLLIFDEPFSGFDPINARMLKDEMLELRNQGATIIFSTHNMSSVEAVCDEITLINNSRNILSGKVGDIRRLYGSDRYLFTFRGNASALIDAFGESVIERGSVSTDATDGTSKLTLRFTPQDNTRDIITRANETVELLGFNSDLPSMDEIFIRTVETNNQSAAPLQAEPTPKH